MTDVVIPVPIFIPNNNGSLPLPIGLAIIALTFFTISGVLWYWTVKR